MFSVSWILIVEKGLTREDNGMPNSAATNEQLYYSVTWQNTLILHHHRESLTFCPYQNQNYLPHTGLNSYSRLHQFTFSHRESLTFCSYQNQNYLLYTGLNSYSRLRHFTISRFKVWFSSKITHVNRWLSAEKSFKIYLKISFHILMYIDLIPDKCIWNVISCHSIYMSICPNLN